jgi:hypothetical protein
LLYEGIPSTMTVLQFEDRWRALIPYKGSQP